MSSWRLSGSPGWPPVADPVELRDVRVQRLDEHGDPVGAVFTQAMITRAQDAADEFDRTGTFPPVTFTLHDVDPELIHLLLGRRPRRGWKGRYCPRLWYAANVVWLTKPWPASVRPRLSTQRARKTHRVGW